jgi:hypothetical protein
MFYRLSYDLARELPHTSRSNVYIMIMIEHFSKWVKLVELPDKSSHSIVVTPLWAKCEGEAHTPKSGKLESSGTPENSKRKCRGQISLHLGALGVIGKVLKCRCPKWPRMSHLDICSPSYGQKKGRDPKSWESTCS